MSGRREQGEREREERGDQPGEKSRREWRAAFARRGLRRSLARASLLQHPVSTRFLRLFIPPPRLLSIRWIVSLSRDATVTPACICSARLVRERASMRTTSALVSSSSRYPPLLLFFFCISPLLFSFEQTEDAPAACAGILCNACASSLAMDGRLKKKAGSRGEFIARAR